MVNRTWKTHAVVLGVVLPALGLACGGGLGTGSASGLAGVLGGAACPELSGGAMNATFDADANANATIRAFVTAAGDLASIAAKAQAEVTAACERMGQDLGVPPEAMRPKNDEGRTQAACNAVAARIDAILKAGASANVRADVTPPRCTVAADVEASCRGQCNVTADPGYIKAHCAPGHLSGRCEGTCSGQCAGTCNGDCQGTCEGQAKTGAASGQCAGRCNGTCKGTCNADCKGTCSVEFKEPKCDVALRAPSVDARCESSCKAHADLTAQCTQASVKMVAAVNTGEIPKLVATLERNLPALIQAEIAYGKRIAGDVQVLVRTGADLPQAFGHLTARAGACIAAAANATVRAQAQISVSVQASASITARAGAGGSAG